MATLRDSKSVAPPGNINSATTPQTIPCPTGLSAGDLLVVYAYFAQGVAGSQTAPAPSNMTKVSTDGTTPTRIGGIFYAIVDNPSTFASGIVINSNSTASRVVGIAQAWTPTSGKVWDATSIVYAGAEYSASAATSDTFPSIASRTLNLGSVMTNKSASTTLTSASAVGGGTDLTQALAPSAATNGPPNTNSVSDSVIAITRGGTGLSYNISQANFRAESFGINEVDSVPSLPTVTGTGFGTVAKFLSTKGATSAHRGLGGTYPEMTEYGVRMAANAGYGMIEISCQRTSDGVWVASHDQTVDRVALETTYDGTQISSLTSTQFLSLHANVGSSGAPQPFATLAQLVATLPSSYVFMLDPKQSGGNTTYMTEFLDLVDSLLGPSRAIMKFDGAATATRFQAAQARGYKTAAYYYAAPATATSSSAVNANLPYVDLPGLNYDADQAGWDAFLNPAGAYYAEAGAKGKKMWGHVCVTQANANTAISKGATYIQSTSTDIAAVGRSAWRPGVGANGLSPKELYAGVVTIKKQYRGDTLVYQRI